MQEWPSDTHNMMEHVCDILSQKSNGAMETHDVARAVRSFIQKMEMVIDYTPEGQYNGKTVIITPPDITDINAQKVYML